MSIFPRASRFASVMILPLVVAQLPANASATHKAHAAIGASAARATNTIIPLPLNPVLPAGQRVCSAKTASGLGYTMLRPAPGAMPAASDYVLVNYIGYLAATGAVFDQGMHASFPVGGVIPGFSKGLQMMGRNGVARFCIPAELGYGTNAAGSIPANSDLVFQVELLDYKTAAEIDAMQKAQAATQTAPAPANSTPPPAQ